MSQTGNLRSNPDSSHAAPAVLAEADPGRLDEGVFDLCPPDPSLRRLLRAVLARSSPAGRKAVKRGDSPLPPPGPMQPLRPPGIAMREAVRRAREYHAHPGWYERYGSVGLAANVSGAEAG